MVEPLCFGCPVCYLSVCMKFRTRYCANGSKIKVHMALCHERKDRYYLFRTPLRISVSQTPVQTVIESTLFLYEEDRKVLLQLLSFVKISRSHIVSDTAPILLFHIHESAILVMQDIK
jgi:hypothetical protein